MKNFLKKLFKRREIDQESRLNSTNTQPSIIKLFRYATKLDVLGLLIAQTLAVICALGQTSVTITVTKFIDKIILFANAVYNESMPLPEYKILEAKFMHDTRHYSLYLALEGLVVLVPGYFCFLIVGVSCTRQMFKMRGAYIKSVLNQDISWYDTNSTGDFASRMIEDITKIEDAIGCKMGMIMVGLSNAIVCVVISITQGWKLALLAIVYLPLVLIILSVINVIAGKLVVSELEAYAEAGSVAEEVFSAVRTVVAFGGQETEIRRYESKLDATKRNNYIRIALSSTPMVVNWLIMFLTYALCFYCGVNFVLDDRALPEKDRDYTASNMLSVFMNALQGSAEFIQTVPFIQNIFTAKAAAAKVYSVIDSEPIIQICKMFGRQLNRRFSTITFENIHFNYPSRQDVKVLNELNIRIKAGEKVALVGPSGCGKSTCVQLLQRFYDPILGNVAIDGISLKDYNLASVRDNIGVVQQEPVLFATTIAENIRLGKPNADLSEILEAATQASAHDFIQMLPEGYNTILGERGAQLSGGQKQRIAIARAIIKKPAILLLDEATSALDTSSEATVQEALDRVSHNCTTIIVAHRLSTIQNADRIIVISQGRVVEEGNHFTLMALQKHYYQLVKSQVQGTEGGPSTKDDDEEFVHNIVTRRASSIYETIAPQVLPIKYMTTSQIFGRVLRLNSPELWMICLACAGAILLGAVFPIYSMILGDILQSLSSVDKEYVRTQRDRACFFFIGIAMVAGVSSFLQWYFLGVSGERLTMRTRKLVFRAILQQEIGYFDKQENGVGSLCARMAVDAAGIQGISGGAVGTLISGISGLLISLGFGIYYDWRLALIVSAFGPFLCFVMYFQQSLGALQSGEINVVELSSKLAMEAQSNIRTVASLNSEEALERQFLDTMGPHYRKCYIQAITNSLTLSLAKSAMSFTNTLGFYYGALLLTERSIIGSDILKVTSTILSSFMILGYGIAGLPNIETGISAARSIFELQDRRPEIKDEESSKSVTLANTDINCKDIVFSYPTRPDIRVLKRLKLCIEHGKTIALVGESGCGKSTIIQLLERYYDPQAGKIVMSGENVRDLTLSCLRRHLGIVSQEPNLFNKTIRENIAYGDNTRTIPEQEILQAAKNANIHNFIMGLPLQYETTLGDRGTQLSGGQKQRIAIARALVRNPKILLLDEATSALDAESEQVVQEALDRARIGRTCITIAHRLKTIQNAEVICVIRNGIVAEMGTHYELLNKKRFYYRLYNAQTGQN